MVKARKRWRWLVGGGLVLGAAIVWAFTVGSETSSRLAARSLRVAVGPPGPPAESDAADPVAEDVEVSAAHVDLGELPMVGPPEPPPTKPRGLANTSFVLLLGLDNRSDKVTGRTDTMILAAFRHRDGKVGAFSIPRDLWIDLPDLGPARISSVVRVGNARVGPGEGLPLLRDAIQRELGIRVDRYAAVDLAGFVDLVDHVGGVDVDVQCPIEDCLWLHPDDETCSPLSLDAGRQHLDGQTALEFARSRHGRGDRDRRRRQQAVLLGFAREVREVGLLGLRELWEAASPYVETDLDWDAAAYYASFALENELDDLHGFSIKGAMVERYVTEKKQHVLVLDRDAFDEALSDMFDRALPGLRERRRCPAPDAAAAARARKSG